MAQEPYLEVLGSAHLEGIPTGQARGAAVEKRRVTVTSPSSPAHHTRSCLLLACGLHHELLESQSSQITLLYLHPEFDSVLEL